MSSHEFFPSVRSAGMTHGKDLRRDVENMKKALSMSAEGMDHFRGVIIDTGTKKSIMSVDQYCMYCSEFRAPMEIRPSQARFVGIGGTQSAIGEAISYTFS